MMIMIIFDLLIYFFDVAVSDHLKLSYRNNSFLARARVVTLQHEFSFQ